MNKHILSGLIILSSLSVTHAQNASYCNSRYDYCLQYDKTLLRPQPESANGDGRAFFNTKQQERLVVYGTSNLDADGQVITLSNQYATVIAQAQSKGAVVSYKKQGSNYFIVSYALKGQIYYQKTIEKNDSFSTALLHYPKTEKKLYDAMCKRIASNFN